ncbi:MAG TPA: hypothetical protein VEY71_09460, partial [Chitinophagales bacterium]|nr:hypothetical protein [Chitinophagales bacterium]
MRLALLFLMFVTNAQAQWQLLSLGATNSAYKINDLCFVNDSVGFAGCWLDDGSPGAIFKTTDGALSWTKTEFPNSIKDVDFISADTGYAVGIAGRVYRTVDQGNSWQLHNTLSPWWDLRSIDFGPGGVSYIGSSAAFCSFCYDSVLVLLRSHDGWQTFEPVALPDSLLTNPWAQLYKVWHLNADTFFVVSVNSVYRTTDGGLTYDYDPVWGNSYTA